MAPPRGCPEGPRREGRVDRVRNGVHSPGQKELVTLWDSRACKVEDSLDAITNEVTGHHATCGVAFPGAFLLHGYVSPAETVKGQPTIWTTLAVAVRCRRTELDLSQEELAAKVGIATRHLQKIEAAEVNVTLRTLSKLAAGLGLLASELLQELPAEGDAE